MSSLDNNFKSQSFQHLENVLQHLCIKYIDKKLTYKKPFNNCIHIFITKLHLTNNYTIEEHQNSNPTDSETPSF